MTRRRFRVGHGHVRYVGLLGLAYSFFGLFVAFCVIAVVVGLIYVYWPLILLAIAVLAIVLVLTFNYR